MIRGTITSMGHEVRGRFGIGLAVAVGLVLAVMTAAAFEPRAARRPAGTAPAPGRFLIASPRLLDPNFVRTVVLLTHYGPEGAMGLVINRPSEVSIAHAVPELSEFSRSSEKLFLGGPVARKDLFLLVQAGDQPKRSSHVFGDVYLGRHRDVLQEVIGERESDTSFRVYAGYTGWGPGQLDAELARGDWLVKPADADSVFFDEEKLWQRLLPPDPSRSASAERSRHPVGGA